jgi:hypothetical protein
MDLYGQRLPAPSEESGLKRFLSGRAQLWPASRWPDFLASISPRLGDYTGPARFRQPLFI